jgi:peptidyl-prolyl cis-trans isomerase C
MSKWQNSKTMKHSLALGFLVLLATAVVGRQSVAAQSGSFGLFGDRVLARGSGFEVKKSLLEERYVLHQASLAARGEVIKTEKRTEIEAELLDKLIVHQVLKLRATQEDLRAAKDSAAKTIAKAKSNAKSEASYWRQLTAVGMTQEQFEIHVMENEINQAVIGRELASQFTVSDADLAKYRNENPHVFTLPEKVRVRHILVSKFDANRKELGEYDKADRIKLAKRLRDRARRGDNFEKLVLSYSDDQKTRKSGGEMIFARGKAVPEFSAASFSLKVGQVSDVVSTQFGYHIIKLEERIPSREVELDEVRNQVVGHLKTLQLNEQLPGYFDKVKKSANVEVLEQTLRL